jgi:hypothetical protein
LTELYRCFEQLKPSLRNQFLSVTYDQCALLTDPQSLSSFLSGMPLKLLTEMLQAAANGKKEISPSLLNFIGKIANAGSISSQLPEREAAKRLVDEVSKLAAPEMAASLFKKEDFGAYVTPDYETTLDQLVRKQGLGVARHEEPFDLQQHLKTFDDDLLAEQIAEVAIVLLAGQIGVELYQELTEQLVRLANELARKAHTLLLSKIQQVFLNYSRTEPADARCTVARAALEQLSDPRLIRSLRESLEASGRWGDPTALSFFFTLGPKVTPEALHLYLHRAEPQREQWLAELFKRYPQHLLKEVIKRLQLNPGAQTENLLTILEKLGSPASTPYVRPFLRDPDEAVRFQALRALLNFNDEEGVAFLKTLLHSKKNQDCLIGLDLAEKYRVARVATDLAKLLKTRFLFYRSDIIRNEKILLAVHKLGYSIAASDLERLQRIRFCFYPKHLARMKSVVSSLLSKKTPRPEMERIQRSILLRNRSISHDASPR